jgi:hypothetical protein
MASKLASLTAIDENVTMDSSSMIDMVFQLLLFFMVSSRLMLNTIDPAVEIPVATNAKPPEEHAGRIIIHVYEDGGFGGINRTEDTPTKPSKPPAPPVSTPSSSPPSPPPNAANVDFKHRHHRFITWPEKNASLKKN